MSHDNPCPVKETIQRLLSAEGCPDPKARVTSVKKEKKLRPGRSFIRVTKLFGATPEDIVGVKVTHRRPTGIQEVNVHTHQPSEMLAYLATALIG